MIMKRILLLLSMFCISYITAQAQVSYTPYYSNQSANSNYAPQSNAQVVRTTAYYEDSYSGQYFKVPIKVSIIPSGYSSQIKVSEKYVTYGYGGQWEKVHNSGNAQKCNPLLGAAGLGSNALEQQFMYKAMMPDGKYYYFDL